MHEKILLANSSTSFAVRLQTLLEHRKHRVAVAYTIAEIFDRIASSDRFDLVVLGRSVDNLPAPSVLESLATSNQVGNSAWLLIENTFSPEEDTLWQEIEAARRTADQIERRLGRPSTLEPYPLRCGPLIINPENREVRIHGKLLKLTPREIQVLYYFVEHVRELIPREDVFKAVWGDNSGVKSQIVDVYVKRLRTVCRAEATELSFRTVSTIGYQLLLRTPVARRVDLGNSHVP